MATRSKKSTTTRNRSTRSRAELTNEFNETVENVSAREEQDATAAQAARQRANLVRENTKGLTVESAVQRITTAKLDVSRALDTVAEELVQKTQELEEVREALVCEYAELEALHGKEVVASSLKALVEDYGKKNKELEQEHADSITRLQQAHSEASRRLDDSIQEKKKAWDRESAEYTYQLQQKRKQEVDKYHEERRQLQIKEQDEERLRERNWQAREETLAAQEKEFTELKTKVATFPDELKKEVAREVAIATNSLKKDYTHQIEVASAQHKATISILEGEKKALLETNNALAKQLAEAQSALTAANEHLRKLSSDALASSSGQAALGALQQVIQNNGVGSAKTAKS